MQIICRSERIRIHNTAYIYFRTNDDHTYISVCNFLSILCLFIFTLETCVGVPHFYDVVFFKFVFQFSSF
jgi:hypothetical protein